jgi:hypothetical protein
LTLQDIVFIVTMGYGVSFFCVFTIIYYIGITEKKK